MIGQHLLLIIIALGLSHVGVATAGVPKSTDFQRHSEVHAPLLKVVKEQESGCYKVLQRQSWAVHEELSWVDRQRVTELAEGFISGQRIFDSALKSVYVPRGRKMRPDHYIVFDYQGAPLVSFFRFEKPLSGALVPVTFAATFGIGVVTLKKMVPSALEVHGVSLGKALRQEKHLWNLLQKKTIGVATHLGHIRQGNNVYVINTYEPGPTFSELRTLHESHKISDEYFENAVALYDEFNDKIADLRKSQEYKDLVVQDLIYNNLNIGDDDAVFVDGEWKVIQF